VVSVNLSNRIGKEEGQKEGKRTREGAGGFLGESDFEESETGSKIAMEDGRAAAVVGTGASTEGGFLLLEEV